MSMETKRKVRDASKYKQWLRRRMEALLWGVLLLLLLSPLQSSSRVSLWSSVLPAAEASSPLEFTDSLFSYEEKRRGVFRYNICNGLSNQILYHAASIAQAIQQNYSLVEIPDYFILQGVQSTDANVLPNANNSAPFGYAFDQGHFLKVLEAEFGIKGRVVRFSSEKEPPKCQGMAALHSANADIMRRLIEAFVPSKQHMQPLINVMMHKLDGNRKNGVCFHHRDGEDWHNHCKRWGSIPDGIYRGNCLTVPGQSLLDAISVRGLQKPGRWVYYCGDHEIPSELSNNQDNDGPIFSVTSRQNIMDFKDDDHAVRELLLQQQKILSHDYGLVTNLSNARDFWALIDFYVCKTLPRFVGNSVSTFSAIQIALRDGHGAYWYNSQSIPLQEMWRVYQLPIVYTYTELSASTGKHLLQTSIASVRRQMPRNKIHILYNGHNDTSFRNWLVGQHVILHDHNPSWRDKIEEMRLNGDVKASHLFLHSGNYFGTWQRIDIPLFLETEYVLLLDADTVIRKPFTLADFGLNLTYSIAMSSEINYEDTVPSNAGVTLMNVPHMRRSHKDFMSFIMRHVKKGHFDHPCPSDQGAYLVFYNDTVRFLSSDFNFKPYWEVDDGVFQRSYIIHYHGPKPHDYIRFIMAKGCDKAVKALCQRISVVPSQICQSLTMFAQASMSVDRHAYCHASFRMPSQAAFCQKLFEYMATTNKCSDFQQLIGEVLDSVPPNLKLPRYLILRRLGWRSWRGYYGKYYWKSLYALTICGWIGLAVYAFRLRSRSFATIVKGMMMACFTGTFLSMVLMTSHLDE